MEWGKPVSELSKHSVVKGEQVGSITIHRKTVYFTLGNRFCEQHTVYPTPTAYRSDTGWCWTRTHSNGRAYDGVVR